MKIEWKISTWSEKRIEMIFKNCEKWKKDNDKEEEKTKINKYQIKANEEKYIKLKECDEIKVKKCQKFNKNPTDRKGCDKRGKCAKVEKIENEKAKSVWKEIRD